MKKKILCGLLCLGLCLPAAQAADNSFADVKEEDWFSSYVSVCVEAGLMNGTGEGNFSPNGVLTKAQAAAIAARLGERLSNRAIVRGTPLPGETLPWYHWEFKYLEDYGIHVSDPEAAATRQDFFDLLSAVTPASALSPINSITSLPDTQDANVLRFYNAGILTGTDEYGTFSPHRGLSRSEAAAMLARVMQPGLRQSFTPQASSAEPSAPAGQEGALSSQTAMTVNGRAVTAQELAFWGSQVAYYWDSYYYSNFGTRLTWSKEVETELMSQAESQGAAYVLMEAKAKELGCTVQQLSAALAPAPTREQLSAYVQTGDLLCAKHILVTDESTAQSVISALEAQPTLEQFNSILSVLGTDPGMTSNPDGYLFTSGQMVESFEQGVRELPINGFSSEPVPSTYGYHVILRLDPLDHPDLIGQYQEAVMNDFVDEALAAAQITLNQDVIDKIDLPKTYENYLQQLSASQK